MQIYQAGIDIGAVAVKLVLLNEENQTVFRGYRCHRAHIPETLRALLNEARAITGQSLLRICLTGAGAKATGRTLGFRFIQEEAAASTTLQIYLPQADIAVELGGESTRIFYRAGREETRINGLCTAGAGFEIDEIAHLLHMNSAGLNQAAANHEYIYPLASRCGVYTKADIQPLMNAGASSENLAASVFQAIVDQTISNLAQERHVRGCVTFLGGPLHFLPELTNRFTVQLKRIMKLLSVEITKSAKRKH